MDVFKKSANARSWEESKMKQSKMGPVKALLEIMKDRAKMNEINSRQIIYSLATKNAFRRKKIKTKDKNSSPERTDKREQKQRN